MYFIAESAQRFHGSANMLHEFPSSLGVVGRTCLYQQACHLAVRGNEYVPIELRGEKVLLQRLGVLHAEPVAKHDRDPLDGCYGGDLLKVAHHGQLGVKHTFREERLSGVGNDDEFVAAEAAQEIGVNPGVLAAAFHPPFDAIIHHEGRQKCQCDRPRHQQQHGRDLGCCFKFLLVMPKSHVLDVPGIALEEGLQHGAQFQSQFHVALYVHSEVKEGVLG